MLWMLYQEVHLLENVLIEIPVFSLLFYPCEYYNCVDRSLFKPFSGIALCTFKEHGSVTLHFGIPMFTKMFGLWCHITCSLVASFIHDFL